MKKKIIIFGSGYHAIVIYFEILKQKKYNFLGFYDEKNNNKIILKYKNKIENNLYKDKKFKINKYKGLGIIGIGHNHIRRDLYNYIIKKNKKILWETIISQNSKISLNVKIGEGCFIMSGCIINNNSIIENHCCINTRASLDHDNHLEKFASVGPGVITGGNVKIQSESYIGIGSVIKNNILIGKNTVVGGGSFVLKNCLSNSLYFGSPARKIKKINKKFNYLK